MTEPVNRGPDLMLT